MSHVRLFPAQLHFLHNALSKVKLLSLYRSFILWNSETLLRKFLIVGNLKLAVFKRRFVFVLLCSLLTRNCACVFMLFCCVTC